MEAERLRFEEPPETEVRFDGTPGRESVSRGRRRNLPDPVTHGVEYEDVRVDYLLASRLRRSEGSEDREADPTDRTATDPE
ncbi:hypothetical protein [Streptomyces oceani]|uniref:Uncharacterized protein n=1 Tax=Streptomyces oceani TaxID=1075402 RepID=A0A1E7KLQ6_9ACTN|nr:hypothetical protein [Streptomyces oceani]OEV04830.1 hypothetical protein AN216_05470 [Streptomyces oceani]